MHLMHVLPCTSSQPLVPLSSLPSLLSSLLYSLSSLLIPCANHLVCLPSAALLCVYIALLCLYAPPWRSWSRAQQRHASLSWSQQRHASLATKTRLPRNKDTPPSPSLSSSPARALSLSRYLSLSPSLSLAHHHSHTLCAHTLYLPLSPFVPPPPFPPPSSLTHAYTHQELEANGASNAELDKMRGVLHNKVHAAMPWLADVLLEQFEELVSTSSDDDHLSPRAR